MVEITYFDIIEALKKQPSKGYEMLYNKYGKPFLNFAIAKWHIDEDDAWEIIYRTIETLVLKLRNYNFDSQKDFERFIFSVFINFLRQNYRSEKYKNEVTFIPLTDIILEKTENQEPIELIESIQNEKADSNIALLHNALEKMDAIDRELLLMRANNFTYEEIAKMMKIENNQLKVKHLRAKQKLIKLYTELK